LSLLNHIIFIISFLMVNIGAQIRKGKSAFQLWILYLRDEATAILCDLWFLFIQKSITA
jgi:hypothetical protein